ncbi:DUF2637 domain-containing protein, partial [Kitasatospora nipponensis]|uniref:DUF2637 domain-containing protein n=1 Tax=Kitasatospora nipponensis TaxID=258049 RepID=UPI0031DC4C8B
MSTATVTATSPGTAHVTGWDRAVVIALGGAGCALSFSALEQMAVAIHVRGFLAGLFPLVIDGFIAYGVRALLVLRDAPLRARFYVWTLFGAATATSVWANALHAVRLNQQSTSDSGLRLGDTVVAVLSTVAPLALAGAVHLYILIARGPVTGADLVSPGDRGQVTAPTDRDEPVPAVTGGMDNTQLTAGQPVSGQLVSGWVTAPVDRPTLTLAKPVTVTDPADLGGQLDRASAVGDRPAGEGPVTAQPVSVRAPAGQSVSLPVTQPPVTDPADRESSDRRADPDTEELLEIAREAVRAEDKLTRKVVAGAI